MLQKIKLQTPDGIKEFFFVPDSNAYDAAKDAGEIVPGIDIVYRQYLVHILNDYQMLILTQIAPVAMGPEFTPNPMGGTQSWSFTINGVPVDPNQFMNGGTQS